MKHKYCANLRIFFRSTYSEAPKTSPHKKKHVFSDFFREKFAQLKKSP